MIRPVGFFGTQTAPLQFKNVRWKDISMRSMRLNFDIMDANTLLVRILNISMRKTLTVDLRGVLSVYFPRSTFAEVDFSCVWKKDFDSSIVKSEYKMALLGFVTVLVSVEPLTFFKKSFV